MNIRKSTSVNSLTSATRRRLARCVAETLENRRFLSGATGGAAHPLYGWMDSGDHFVPAESTSATPAGTTTPLGLTPAQIRHAYGFDQISFGNVAGDGSGQTIAIVTAFDHPGFASSTSPSFASSDLHQFDQQLGIADPPSFTKIDQFGGTDYPTADSSWANETALDVEWIHALAPGANLVLVEAHSNFDGDMHTAVEMARRYPGVSVVSMSWGSPQGSADTNFGTAFSTLPNHTGQTFVAASGDAGAPGQTPATLARVLSVGGTEFTLGSNDTYGSEIGWSGSGGGIATYEAKPAYQSSVTQSSTKRTIPDVAFASTGDAGASVYDSYNDASAPWISLAGTSFSVLGWSALLGIVNQGRTIAGAGTLDGSAQTLPGIYSLPQSAFHDITSGNNDFSAGPGYDLVTGRGTPIANLVASGLVNYSRGQISGSVFKDTSLDGSLNALEPVVANQTVFIDTNGNNALDSGERSTRTDAWGNYAFNNLSAAGSYTIVTVPPSGYTFSGSGQRQTIALASNANRAGVDFSFIKTGTASLSGTVYDDANGNGVRDSGEAGKAGARIYFEVNNNAYADPYEQSVVTDSSGNYTFSNLAGGASYSPVMVEPSGYLDTTGTTSVTLANAQHATGHDFGVTNHPFISGNVFRDTDGDGSWDGSESTESGWTIYIDSNDNHALDAGEPFDVTGAGGDYQIGGLGFGTYTVREVPRSGYTQTAPAGGSYSISFDELTFANTQNFGNKPGATSGGSISGTVYNDANGDRARNSGEAGVGGITIYNDANNNSTLDAGEITTVTDSSGVYMLSGLGTGSFKVREILQSGWSQTTPTNNYGWTITLAANQHVTSKDFGTRSSTPPITGSLSGFTFNDNNANGTFDAGDAKTSGKTVFLDTNNNGALDSGEKSVVTDSSGNFSFTGLSAGTYHVRRVFPSGYTSSTPLIDVTLASGQSLSNLTIGSKQGTSATKTGSISGFSFNDNNKNGAFDAGDVKTSGKTIFLDSNSNGKFDTGETSKTSDANGAFAFTGLAAGTYHLRRVFPSGYTYSTPLIDLVVTSAGETFTNELIGSKSIA